CRRPPSPCTPRPYFFSDALAAPRRLPSFPTRRSSDLAASGVGSLLGGWFTGRLMGAGRSLDFSRKAAMGASVAVMPLIFFVTRRSEEHTSELQSLTNLVCRLLLAKKKDYRLHSSAYHP